MTDISPAGPMSMIKIDGAKIKLLREQQGLTQLYLATAVEVTTDTISRWENKRYPSIKRDNGLKLAEALNVPLEEILENVLQDSSEEELEDSPPPATEQAQPAADPAAAPTGSPGKRTLIALAGALMLIAIGITWYFYHFRASEQFTAQRILPAHCIAGQPFPVIIKISGLPATPTALIIKENPPPNATIKATMPKVAANGLKNKQIKWLKKIEGKSVFAYLVTASGKEGEKLRFSGTAAIRSKSELPITGAETTVISHYHWADTNEDNIISDDEILAVYERYGELTDLDIDIDLIEEMWMGSSYKWDAATKTFKIID